MDTKEQMEQVVKEYILEQPLTDLEFYQINDRYIVPDPDHTWIIDGGIELTFGEKKFSFGWHDDFSFMHIVPGPISDLHLSSSSDFRTLEAKNADGLKNLIGQKIINIQFKWNYYREYDENFEMKDEKKYIPFELFLVFENSHTLQLSSIDYRLSRSGVTDMNYVSQGEMLIALNQKYKIIEEDYGGEQVVNFGE